MAPSGQIVIGFNPPSGNGKAQELIADRSFLTSSQDIAP